MQALSIVWQCLAYCNSCVNPVIYNHTSKDFRDAFRGTFSSTTRRDFSTRDARTYDVSTRGGSVYDQRSAAVGRQRSLKALDAAPPADVIQQQQKPQQHGAVADLSDCSDRVHLEG